MSTQINVIPEKGIKKADTANVVTALNICPECGRMKFTKRWDGVECAHCGRWFKDLVVDDRPALNIMMQCPECGCRDFVKAGEGRFQCMDCGKLFNGFKEITARAYVIRPQRIKRRKEAVS